MRKQVFLMSIPVITGLLLSGLYSFSQNVLPPLQPEQDACNALSLCGGMFSTPYSYQGTGNALDLSGTPCGSGETNSVWIRITIATGGWLVFNIIPVDTADDYDFAVLDVTGIDCRHLSPSDVVRCNFNNDELGSNLQGIVGLNMTSTVATVASGAFGSSFCEAIVAAAGQTYLIMVNNFGHDDLSGPSKGFTIDFSASTAVFEKNPPPELGSIIKQCSDTSVTVELTKPVLCSSIAADGSDFYITPFVAIDHATGMNCISGNGYTSEVTIGFSGHAPVGNYVLHAREGTDGNTLLNFCADPLLLPASLPFPVPSPVQDNFLPADTVKCFYSTILLGAGRGFEQYLWSTGQTTPAIRVIDPGLYTLMVTDSNACTGLGSISIKDSVCPQFLYLPTAFTPNADGRNDIFRPLFAGAVSNFKFAVYDRWGRPLQAGTYVWVCIYNLYQQPEQVQKGTVLLIR